MRPFFPLVLALSCILVNAPLEGAAPKFKKIVVSDKFHGEGCTVGDFNKDGKPDIASGHFWYEGPDFTKKHPIYEGEDFKPENYSNCFGMFTGDFNADGWDDILVCPHPGTTGYWYENPKGQGGLWKAHEATIELGNESQMWTDINGDGKPEVLFNRNKILGFCTYDPKKPGEPWKFTAVSGSDDKYQRYTHGLGAGDINGDGRIDILDKDGWWECPEDASKTPWTFHPFHFSAAAAHMLVFDVDGDGLNDVVTAWHCHLYGLVWYKQVRNDKSEVGFEKNVLIPTEPGENFFPKVSQLHAFVAADINDDGVMDFVTGKRFWAHGPNGDVAPNDPAILMWWEIRRKDGKVEMIPHVIDEDSGVGTQFAVEDLNGDGRLDVIIGNKKGTFVFLQEK